MGAISCLKRDSPREGAVLTSFLRVLLTFNATSLLLIVYQIKAPFLLSDVFGIRRYLFNVGLLSMPMLLTGLSILAIHRLGKDSFSEGQIHSIEHANNSFLPSYLGYFFVALSVPNLETLFFVYGILFVFTYLSQALYFNPFFLFYGFKFYNATTAKGTVIFLISKKNYRIPTEIAIGEACRINGYTLLEKG